jgi:Predicted membrane protein
MSDPLLDKMDALLKKHQGGAETAQPVTPAPPPAAAAPNAPPPLPEDAWLPVLTDVVAVGTPDTPSAPQPAPEVAQEPPPPPPPPEPAVDPAVLVEQIMGELEPRLNSLLRDRLVAEVRNTLDDSLSALLAQMDVHIREIVREAVAEQLGKP